MCVGVWTLEHPDYALILATNRDEFLERPTTDAQFHSEHNVLSGTDLLAGGTWLGINSKNGKIGVLTNITEVAGTYTSRGHLVSSFLTNPDSSVGHTVGTPDATYAGFNMLLLSSSSAHSFDLASFVTNHGGGGTITSRPLTAQERQYGAFSNGVDGQGGNEWPKVQQLLESFKQVMKATEPKHSEDELKDRLFDILNWRSASTPTARHDLRNTVLVDPISMSVDSNTSVLYGTRLHTLIFVRRNGHVTFIERDVWKKGPDGTVFKQRDFSTDRVFEFEMQNNASR